jgi:hypothetical protein
VISQVAFSLDFFLWFSLRSRQALLLSSMLPMEIFHCGNSLICFCETEWLMMHIPHRIIAALIQAIILQILG